MAKSSAKKKGSTSSSRSKSRGKVSNKQLGVRSLLIVLLSALILFGVYYLADPADLEARLSEVFTPATVTSQGNQSQDDYSSTSAASPSPTTHPQDAASQTAQEPTASDVSSPVGTLEVFFIDVGQGDSVFLRSPNGHTMLIDAGESSAFNAVDTFLVSQDVSTLDVVLATHPHSDHIGAMTKVLKAYDVGTFYMPDVTHTTKTYENMINILAEKNIKTVPAAAGENSFISWDDDVEVRILSPFSDEDYDGLNDYSIIIRVKYKETAVMLTGDSEMHAEGISLSRLDASLFKADVLKLGHHGSSSSTSRAFFDAVDPSIAIICLGKDNDYGHPHAETLELLNESGITYYRTDESGTIHVTLDGASVSVTTEK